MKFLAKVMEVCRRLRFHLYRRRREGAIEDEICLHLELRARANQALGMSADDARLAARASFGDLAVVLKECREAWVGPPRNGSRFRALALVLVAFIALSAVNDFFAPALTLAYRTGALGVAEALGLATAGDDYRRFIPLMDAAPLWLHGLWVLAGVMYLRTIVRVIRRRPGGHLLVLAAVSIELVATLLSRPIEAAAGVVVNPNASTAVLVLPFGLPLTLAAFLWVTGRRTQGPGDTSLLEA
jgi:hypothetical protein